MTIHFPKRIAVFLAAAVIGGFGSYNIGVAGTNPMQAITDSRCRAGAFLTHVDPSKNLGADAQNDAKATSVNTQQDPATTISTPVATSGSNLMPNPGVEAVKSGSPTGWSNNHYGSNDAQFTQVLGHNSSRAVRIDIASYTDGTADWFTDPISVNPGTYYQFADYYRSNVATHATLMLRDADGHDHYIPLGSVPASTSWAQYSARFFVPSNVHQILISHTLDRLGSLETDDYSLLQAQSQGFSQALVSVTFDDGWQSIYTNAMPIMDRYGVSSTQYIISGYLGQHGYDTVGQVYDFQSHGHEIASHTVDHKDLTTLTDKQLQTELEASKKGLSKCFAPTTDFAAPYGSYNQRTTKAEASVYQTARSTDSGFNSADQFNPYELKVENVRADTTPAQIQAWLDTARANNLWLILVYHQVDDAHGEYSRTPAEFESDIQKIVASGIKVETMHDAYASIKPQLKH